MFRSELPEHLRPLQVSANGLYATYPENTVGRDFVVGDIHGHFSKVEALLKLSGFQESRDRLFAVGDLVDRGPESVMSAWWLQQPWFLSVRGNHEQWCIDAASGEDAYGHEASGGEWFYSLPGEARGAYRRLFSQLPVALDFFTRDLDLVGVLHAECPYPCWETFTTSLMGASSRAVETALWGRSRITQKDTSLVGKVDRIYAGHTIVETVTALGNVIYLDTGSFTEDGCITMVEVGGSGAVFSI